MSPWTRPQPNPHAGVSPDLAGYQFTLRCALLRIVCPGYAELAMAQLGDTRVLVTGGTSGLGRAMAQALAQAGARVVVTSRDRARAQATAAELGDGALGIE